MEQSARMAELKKFNLEIIRFNTNSRERHRKYYTLSEALWCLAEHYSANYYIQIGDKCLCRAVHKLWAEDFITWYEHYMLRTYIENNRPSKWSSWSAFRARYSGYYWKPNDYKNRLRWIIKHARKNENK